MNQNPTIRKAKEEDLNQLFTLSKKAYLGNLDKTISEKYGFLVSDFSKEDYTKFIKYADYFYTAGLAEHGIAGFVLAYRSSKINRKNEWTNMFLRYFFREPFVMVKQLCVDRPFSSLGIGKALYTHLCQQTQGVPLVTAIVVEPKNKRSERFHNKFGFEQIMIVQPSDDETRPRSIWWYSNGAKRPYFRVKMIKAFENNQHL
ncbi:MAG: GNAT family N-acetyltransferase [Deltaproteobacteria bacterium]|nr:GNAT family N-acetyltransferase [Deltaproteobacteria bacterium]